MCILASTSQMKELDRTAIEDWKISSLRLMERAAGAVADRVARLTPKDDAGFPSHGAEAAGGGRQAGSLCTHAAAAAGMDPKQLLHHRRIVRRGA